MFDVDWEKRIDWDKLREYRFKRLVSEIKSEDLDAIMVTKLDNIRYITSFRPVYSLWFHGNRYIEIVTREKDSRFLVASGDYERVKNTMPWIKDFVPFPFLISEGLDIVVRTLKDLGLDEGKVGVDMLPFSLYCNLEKKLKDVLFVDGMPVLDRARSIKHEEEIKVMRSAAEVADVGMQKALDSIKEGVKELEVSALAAKAMIDEGAEHVPYLPLVESGEHGWIGYRFPTDKRIRKGEMIYIDTGACIVNGYNGDIARVKIVGKPSKKQTEIYRVMYDMLFEATDKLRHRTNTKEVVEAARKVAKKSGYEKNIYFGIIGHGIGTDLHEPPTIGERVVEHKESEVLQKNMVVCLEPGILLPNVGGGHLENMILIRDGKPEILTKTGFEEEIL